METIRAVHTRTSRLWVVRVETSPTVGAKEGCTNIVDGEIAAKGGRWVLAILSGIVHIVGVLCRRTLAKVCFFSRGVGGRHADTTIQAFNVSTCVRRHLAQTARKAGRTFAMHVIKWHVKVRLNSFGILIFTQATNTAVLAWQSTSGSVGITGGQFTVSARVAITANTGVRRSIPVGVFGREVQVRTRGSYTHPHTHTQQSFTASRTESRCCRRLRASKRSAHLRLHRRGSALIRRDL